MRLLPDTQAGRGPERGPGGLRDTLFGILGTREANCSRRVGGGAISCSCCVVEEVPCPRVLVAVVGMLDANASSPSLAEAGIRAQERQKRRHRIMFRMRRRLKKRGGERHTQIVSRTRPLEAADKHCGVQLIHL